MNKIIRWNLKNFISNKKFLGKMSNKKVSNLYFIFHIFFFYFQFLFLAVCDVEFIDVFIDMSIDSAKKPILALFHISCMPSPPKEPNNS